MEEIDLIDLVTELLLHIQQKTGFIVEDIVDIGNMPEIGAIICKLSETISKTNRQQENQD